MYIEFLVRRSEEREREK